MTGPTSLVLGVKLRNVPDINSTLESIRSIGFGFVCANIVSQQKVLEQLQQSSSSPTGPFTWSDLSLSANDWRRGVVGVITNFCETLKSSVGKESFVRRTSELVDEQISYCQHVCLSAIVIELPEDFVNLANILNSKLNNLLKGSNAYWIKIPMASGLNRSSDDETDTGTDDPWNIWNSFRTLCEFDRFIFPALELHADVPSKEEVNRWLGEPVKSIFISTNVFLTNQEGFPVLSKAHQKIVKQFLKLKAQVVIEAENFDTNLKFYNQYIQYLWSRKEESLSDDSADGIQVFAAGYEDTLQIPLQPLRDHLESSTYEVFEKDPVKYVLYEDAIYRAIVERVFDSADSSLILMVLGAGRGPLVIRSLAAACRAKKNIHVYAVEKNTNAINTLYHLRDQLWGESVTVVCADMREFNPSVKADIIVSELLGSLGDNELSPECLDGAQRYLKPDGIMIPKSYTSFISPMMSMKYHQDLAVLAENTKYKFAQYETPYIVHMNNKYIIASPQKLFTFEHPNIDSEHSNDRYISRTFTASQDCLFNGFSGYFESVLYGDILMSILPSTHSRGMFSWFPVFIPLREPVQVKKGDSIVAHFWRKSSKTSVWYEWTITAPIPLGIHNANGRSGNMLL